MKFCWHDFEIVETKSLEQIKLEITSIPVDLYENQKDYDLKVCLKCGLIVDEISPQKRFIQEMILTENNRKQKAKELLKNYVRKRK